jgi:hypothetical protein
MKLVLYGSLAAGALAIGWLAARRPRVGAARIARSLLYAIVFLFAALCLQPFRGDVAAACGAAAGALFFVLVAAAGARPAGQLDVIATNVCAILVGAELTLHLVAWIKPSPLFAQLGSDAGQRVESLRMPNKPRAGGIPYNSWGDYDTEPSRKKPGECLAVTIGDSFAAGVVPHAWHFTTVAERALPGCSVYNMGQVRIGPREYRYLLEKNALGLNPDIIVIDLFIGNDLSDDYGCNPSPFRKLFDRENLLVYTVPRRLTAWAGERRRLGAGQQVGVPQMDNALADVGFPWLTDPLKEQESSSPEEYLRLEARRAREICAPEASRYYPDFFVALDELVKSAGQTRLAFLLIPDELQVEDDLWNQVTSANPGLALDRERPQRVVGEWLKARNVPYLDLLPLMRAAPAWTDGKKHFYHLRDTHFNARGNELAGKALADFLKPFLKH